MKVNKERLLELFLKLVSINSESGNEAEIIDFLKKKLIDLNIKTNTDKAGNLIGITSGQPKLLLSAHVDTVQPGNNVLIIRDKDGTFHTDGKSVLGGDDKSGVASIVEILTTLKENELLQNLQIIFTVQEEIGNIGALGLDFSEIQPRVGINFDSEPGDIIVGEPEKFHFDITIHGRAAHAGDHPERGIDVIQVASKAISKLEWGRIDEETTANVGRIEGGLSRNIVPETIRLEAEIRSRSKDKLDLLAENLTDVFNQEANLVGATIEIEKIPAGWSYTIPKDNEFVELLAQICRNNKVEPDIMVIGGNTDAGLLNQNGILTLTTGSCGKKIHTTEEYISEERLETGTQIGLESVLEFLKIL
jgi:tripeptide aminopeptidase